MSTTDANGGYMVPLTLDPAIMLSSDGSNNPLRQIARVAPTTTNAWQGVLSAGASAEWKAEAEEAADGSPTLSAPASPQGGQALWWLTCGRSGRCQSAASGSASTSARSLDGGRLTHDNDPRAHREVPVESIAVVGDRVIFASGRRVEHTGGITSGGDLTDRSPAAVDGCCDRIVVRVVAVGSSHRFE
jgi:hypothetical protein